MARSKPAASPSAKQTQPNGVVHHLDDAVHNLEKRVEEQVELLARDPVEQREAGLMQLVVCVGGIYASL